MTGVGLTACRPALSTAVTLHTGAQHRWPLFTTRPVVFGCGGTSRLCGTRKVFRYVRKAADSRM